MIRYFCGIFRSIIPAVASVGHEEDWEKSYRSKMPFLFFNESILSIKMVEIKNTEKEYRVNEDKRIIALRGDTLLINL